jgi:aldose 1-epimerase
MRVDPRLHLQSSNWRAEISASAGGRLTRLDWLGSERPVPILAPWPDITSFDPHAWPKAGAFPMLPFSNQLAGGRFTWAGQHVQLELSPGATHALHGVAHRMPWEVVSACDSSASLRYRHASGTGGWPWPFEAKLDIHLSSDSIEVRLSIRNVGDTAAPAALGWHPYHPYPSASSGGEGRLTQGPGDDSGRRSADRRALSLVGGPGCPVGSFGVAPSADPTTVRIAEHNWDAASLPSQTTAFECWDGRLSLRLASTHCLIVKSTSCPYLVLHVPSTGSRMPDYLCLEPVTLLPGALKRNYAHQRDLSIGLLPGEVRTISWRCQTMKDEGCDD